MSIDLIKGIASCHTVAEEIARAYGLSEDSQTDLCSRLLGAVASGDIQARKPDGMERAMIGNDWLAMMPVHHPHVWDEDVNKWLAGKYRYVWVPEGSEPIQNQGINVLPSKTFHKQRGNSLDMAIRKAIKEAGCDETAAVYTALHKLALNDDALPFTGGRVGSALCYTNDNDEITCLTKDALGKRLGRLRNKAA